MKALNFYKGQATGDQTVESVTIILDEEIPSFQDDDRIEKASQVHKHGERLADVLCNTLPGGTLDRLIARLFEKRASQFIIPMFQDKS